MLKHIPPLLGPELLATLRAMGHGDEIVIADANFPASFLGPEVHRADGIAATDMLDAVLTLLPLDDFVDQAAIGMAVVGDPEARPPIFAEFAAIIARHEPKAGFSTIERYAFYDRARQAAAVIQTGETRLYGNVILKKGVIRAAA
ncbi:RbsD/FucU domain-containing protein [Devosia sp. YIM 151766]|uniref:RbsD/FucU family protein n=1 Tax=Devosia sp. YIM 151766 TaxID=3017325 RepID=UPI00255CAFCB|nr:RbsD/FucU domain-containing protein [Devosia sp. YIM 151766]WIY52407.1 RbsD/FucU domain-containing protein [Devosia sp. YIM 151766]